VVLLLIGSVVYAQLKWWGFYPDLPPTGVITQAMYDAALGTKHSPVITLSKVDHNGNTRQFLSNSPETITSRDDRGKLWVDYGQGADMVSYHGYISHVNLINYHSHKEPKKKVIGLIFENMSKTTDYAVTLQIAGGKGNWDKQLFMAGAYTDMTGNWATPTTLNVKRGEIRVLKSWEIAEWENVVVNFRMTVSDGGAAGPVRCRLATVVGDVKAAQDNELISIMKDTKPPLLTASHPRGSWSTSQITLSNENHPIDLDKMAVNDVTWLWLCKPVFTNGDKTGYNNDIPYLSTNSYQSQSDIIAASKLTEKAITNKGMYGVYTHIDLIVVNNDTANPATTKKFGLYLRQPEKYPNGVGAPDYNGVLSVNASEMGCIWLENNPADRQFASQCLVSDLAGTIAAGGRKAIPIDIMHVGPAMLPVVFVVKRLQ